MQKKNIIIGIAIMVLVVGGVIIAGNSVREDMSSKNTPVATSSSTAKSKQGISHRRQLIENLETRLVKLRNMTDKEWEEQQADYRKTVHKRRASKRRAKLIKNKN